MNIFEQYGIKEVMDACFYAIELDDNENERMLSGENSNVLVFPYNLQPGNHRIRVCASLGRCVKSADMVINVVRTKFADVRPQDYYHDRCGR